MSLSGWLRAAWLAVPAALVCGGAVAQQIIRVPPGMVVVLTPGQMPLVSARAKAPVLVESTQEPSALPIERLFAEQQAMMDRIMADMNAMLGPIQTPAETMARFGAQGPEVMPVAGGTYCEESVSVTYNGRNSAPIVKVSQAGSGCGPTAGAAPVPAESAPPERSRPPIIQVDSPPRVMEPRVRHHT